MRIWPADPPAIEAAAAALLRGQLVALPTETVYGLGASALDPRALAAIFAVKGRPADHPLIVHVHSAGELDRWARSVPADAWRLAEAFWPGPLTLVVPRRDTLPPAATGGRDSVGLRVPDHPVALALLEAAGVPIAAPSANRFGRVSPTTAADVLEELSGAAAQQGLPDVVFGVLDGGPCRIGVESTIVELLGPEPMLLRPGGVPIEAIEDVLGRPLVAAQGPARASGMLASHYAPRVAVELADSAGDARQRAAELCCAGRRVGLLGVDDAPGGTMPNGMADGSSPAGGAVVVVPGAAGDDAGYARWLYRRLRDADDAGLDVLIAVLPPARGLGPAVRDRLRKAAAPRP